MPWSEVHGAIYLLAYNSQYVKAIYLALCQFLAYYATECPPPPRMMPPKRAAKKREKSLVALVSI